MKSICIYAAVIGLVGCSSGDVDSRKFLGQAMQDGIAEIQVCQLALQKSENPEVKRFAQRLIADHSRMDSDIASVAQTVGVTVPNQPSTGKKSVYQRLSKLSGRTFDRAFIDHNVRDHKSHVKEFGLQADAGSEVQVRELAQRELPILQQHLQLSQQIADKIRSSG
jgi:putative membrane protein